MPKKKVETKKLFFIVYEDDFLETMTDSTSDVDEYIMKKVEEGYDLEAWKVYEVDEDSARKVSVTPYYEVVW